MSELNPKDYFVDGDIAKARTLPLNTLWDKKFLQHELETVFRTEWLCFPKAALQQPTLKNNRSIWQVLELRGNAARYNWLGESLFFKRDFLPAGEAQLRLFLNRCPHAFYPMLLEETDESRARQIVCQQHGLVVGCDGKFKSHPGFLNATAEEQECLSLQSYDVEDWFEFLFINRGKKQKAFAEAFAPIFESVSKMPMQKLRYMKQAEERRIVDGNWKQHAWNYMDAFHIHWIHKGPGGLQDAVDMGTYHTEVHDSCALQWVCAKKPEQGFDPAMLPERFSIDQKRVFALWWLVFPNVTLNFYPWGLSINVYQPLPDDPTRTEFLWMHYTWDEELYTKRDKLWLSAQVDAEDVDAMSRVDEAIRSKSNPWQRGLFSTQTEAGPHWFHRKIFERCFPGSL